MPLTYALNHACTLPGYDARYLGWVTKTSLNQFFCELIQILRAKSVCEDDKREAKQFIMSWK